MNYDAWTKYKTRLTKQYDFIKVVISDLQVFRHSKYSVALFKQYYRSNRFEAYGWKRLYLLGEGDQAKILSEETKYLRQGAPGVVANPPVDLGGESG
jgi:hypothetical protein